MRAGLLAVDSAPFVFLLLRLTVFQSNIHALFFPPLRSPPKQNFSFCSTRIHRLVSYEDNSPLTPVASLSLLQRKARRFSPLPNFFSDRRLISFILKTFGPSYFSIVFRRSLYKTYPMFTNLPSSQDLWNITMFPFPPLRRAKADPPNCNFSPQQPVLPFRPLRAVAFP